MVVSILTRSLRVFLKPERQYHGCIYREDPKGEVGIEIKAVKDNDVLDALSSQQPAVST